MLYLLAGRVGQVVNYSSLASDVGVSAVTIKSWVEILKQSFILFELRPYFKNIGKQLVKSSKLYFIDTGILSFLLKLRTEDMVERDPLRGQLYENLIIIDIVKNRLNSGLEHDMFFFRDSHGHEVDLLISQGASFVPIEIKSAETFSDNFLKGINYFKKSLKSP
jgi:predicted AAA+ superfamily ATPase